MQKTQINMLKKIFRKDNAILAAYLFGSQAIGKINKYSDIDIAVLFDEKLSGKAYTDKQIVMITHLSKVLNKEVDVIILNHSSLFLKYHILKQGIKIYESLYRNEHNFEAQAILQYFDFLPIKNRIENGLLAKIKEA